AAGRRCPRARGRRASPLGPGAGRPPAGRSRGRNRRSRSASVSVAAYYELKVADTDVLVSMTSTHRPDVVLMVPTPAHAPPHECCEPPKGGKDAISTRAPWGT